MPVWTYHTDPAFRVTTSRYFGARAYGDVSSLYAFRDALRRNLREATTFQIFAGFDEPERAPSGEWRFTIVGLPYRAWEWREIIGGLRNRGLGHLRILLIDTHTANAGLLIYDSATAPLEQLA